MCRCLLHCPIKALKKKTDHGGREVFRAKALNFLGIGGFPEKLLDLMNIMHIMQCLKYIDTQNDALEKAKHPSKMYM